LTNQQRNSPLCISSALDTVPALVVAYRCTRIQLEIKKAIQEELTLHNSFRKECCGDF